MGIETNSHQCGTLRFGEDPATSVLDPLCRSHDVENLYVVDSSFFPSSAAMNPALTIAAQASARGGAPGQLVQELHERCDGIMSVERQVIMSILVETKATGADPTIGFPRADWATTRPTERARRIKARLLENERQIDVERARYTTESYRATEGEPMAVRRAKMLLHLVRTQTITIEPDELIVGNRSLLPRMGVIAPEGAVDWIDRELETLPTRPQDRFNITPDQIRRTAE